MQEQLPSAASETAAQRYPESEYPLRPSRQVVVQVLRFSDGIMDTTPRMTNSAVENSLRDPPYALIVDGVTLTNAAATLKVP